MAEGGTVGFPVPGRAVLSVRFVIPVLVLVVNDHLLKGFGPAWATGKLSDFAGLAFAPFVLVAWWEVLLSAAGRWHGPRRRPMVVAIVATASIFAAVKLTGAGAAGYSNAIGAAQWAWSTAVALVTSSAGPAFRPVAVVRDASDLVALLGLIPALAAARGARRAEVSRRRRAGHSRAGAIAVTLLAAGAGIASSPAAPGLYREPTDNVTFTREDRAEIRHLKVELRPGASGVRVEAEVNVRTSGIGSPPRLPISVIVTRDRDGQTVARGPDPDHLAGTIGSIATTFFAIAACEPPADSCQESFTLSFDWLFDDSRDSLAFDWSVRLRSVYPTDSAVPPGARLEAEISR